MPPLLCGKAVQDGITYSVEDKREADADDPAEYRSSNTNHTMVLDVVRAVRLGENGHVLRHNDGDEKAAEGQEAYQCNLEDNLRAVQDREALDLLLQDCVRALCRNQIIRGRNCQVHVRILAQLVQVAPVEICAAVRQAAGEGVAAGSCSLGHQTQHCSQGSRGAVQKRPERQTAQVETKGVGVGPENGASLVVHLGTVHIGCEVPHLRRPRQRVLRAGVADLQIPEKHQEFADHVELLLYGVREGAGDAIASECHLPGGDQINEPRAAYAENDQLGYQRNERLKQERGFLEHALASRFDTAHGGVHGAVGHQEDTGREEG
mmetsp:Transcript_4808/g.18208  ORF Transcript_4808/g.18208 Transcript_4808/m.18208 type:complete len:321 (+) Transcript_4808:259-1221(+)|eukprot:CAMPEP_0204175424 /NCGR_PEP_ID=MMETSP0361-20130328/46736_1 /ASSEMBLY_ACC=CAM_ASM_000343 /TAXON_ID=268821 /ORGANISM="Scrippsiella Hangoei, Strain SHTV-5" /LENGTH=320 /DNA_ID=CAMNT_0051134065 /DNA_START=190 /DNA_END=1152 /DNA_ORIENTATION=+